MKLSEKLEAFGIDLKNDKEEILKAKKALDEAGLPVKSVAAKLDSNQEMVIEKLFSKKNNTVKQDTDNGGSKLSFWKKSTVKVIARTQNASDNVSKASLKKFDEKKEVDNQATKKVRALPESTLLELKRKKEEQKKLKENNQKAQEDIKLNENNSESSNSQDESIKDTQNTTKLKENNNLNKNANINNNINNSNNKKIENKNSNNNNNSKNNNFSNNKNNLNISFNNKKDFNKDKKPFYNNNNKQGQYNKNNQDKKVPQIPNQGGTKKNIVLNKNNADSVTGTNNRFIGKERDKTKYNKDITEQKKVPGKNKLNKSKGGNKNLQNYTEEEKGHTRLKNKSGKGAFIRPEIKEVTPEETIKSIKLPDTITIKDLSSKLKLQPSVIVKKLFMTGKMVTPNTELSYEEAENIAIEYDILCEKEEKVDVIAELLKETEEDTNKMINRPPVVCVMGHVDHGKTSILDAIRKTNVTQKEAGGITQAIGAYQVKINDKLITFLDTPGHEAFTQMRMRGANATDIAVLVVAADDGVMPQTIEAINHAKAAKVEIVVAVNKIDKEDANIQKVKEELSKYDLVPSDWGGSTTFVPVSAKKQIGITDLLEMILLTADVLDLKANPRRNARGVVIEAELDKGKGPVARVLVQKGTLKVGDHVAMGPCYGKVRAMMDYNGEKVKEATPSMPVEILGLSDVPNAGDVLIAFDSEKEAKDFAAIFVAENKKKMVEASKQKVSLEDIGDMIKSGELKELPIVIKADVIGSCEAVKDSLEKLTNDEVKVKVIHSGVGNVNESDATLASASNAIIIGFNVKPDSNAKSIIEREKVEFKQYDIIYNAIEDIERAIKGLQAPVYEEKVIGHATIRQIFKSSGVGAIAGSYVDDGMVQRNAKVRIYRGKDLIHEGQIDSVKRFKDDVKEVKNGFECGIVFDDFSQFETGDTIECYIMQEKKDDNE